MSKRVLEWALSCVLGLHRMQEAKGHVLLAAVIALGATLAAPQVHAAVGRTSGSHNVGNNGSFSYSIPIFTPPGPRGIQPSVALSYNSNAGTGILGRGWRLSGELESMIHQCPLTLAQDPSMIGTMPYCLDGNRLRKQSGTYYGSPGSVYMTEVADSSRITFVGGSYPNYYWTVEQKDGLIYTYGGGGNSNVLSSYVYRLREIRDRAGNKVRFTWKAVDSTTSGTTHPVKIEWTQSSAGSGTYVHSMDFIYSAGGNAANSSRNYKRPTGDLEFDSDLLTAITVSTSGTVKRKYVLTYDNSPTTVAKRLAQITECSDSAATDCLAPTTISYQSGENGFETVGTGYGGDGHYDFNGDRIKDLWNGTQVRFGSASGYGPWISTGVSAPSGVGRLNGTAADQILGASGGTFYVYGWNGSSFSATSTGIAVSAIPTGLVIADVNGDDRDDLVYSTYPYGEYLPSGEFCVLLSIRHNTSTGGSPSFASPSGVGHCYGSPPGYPPNPPNWYETLPWYWDIVLFQIMPTLSKGGDMNGDGREDLNVQLEWSWLFYDSASPYAPVGSGTYSSNGIADFADGYGLYIHDIPYDVTLIDADFNGDNCDDFLVSGGVTLSSCFGYYNASMVTDDSGIGSYAGFADWNSDNRDDYFVKDGSGAIYVRPFVGNAMGSAVYTGIVSSSDVRPTDGNGDGLDDIVFSDNVYFHKSGGVFPDLVSEVEDGFGVTYAPTYASSAGSGSHTPGTTASYPSFNIVGGLRLVSSVTASDGIGGTYDTDYHYHDARGNVLGRGFLGFAGIDSVDSRTGIKRELQFEQTFPYVGMLKSDKLYQPAGSGGYLISSRTFTVDYIALDTAPYNGRTLPYTYIVAEDVYEVGGSSNGNKITSSTTTSTYDGWGNLTAMTRTVTDEDAYSPLYGYTWTTASSSSFTPNTTYWCLGLPTSSSVTSSTTVAGESSVTRSRGFSPDYINCRMDAVYVEPSSSTLYVDTSYGYDSFGNVSAVYVTGRNPNGTSMSTRTTAIGWGTTGQFPVSETNALSQTTTRTFHTTFGSLVTETDPNGIVVANNEYDTFGHLTRENRPDGTAVTHDHYNCVAQGWCLDSENRRIVVTSARDTSNGVIRSDWGYFDQFERPIITMHRLLDGSYNRIDRQYDALGRVYRDSAPCAESSCTNYWITNTYDLLGRVTQQSRPLSQSSSTPVATTIAHAGRTYTVTDPNSKNSVKILDVNGRMRRSTDHDGYYQSFGYDAAGSLKQVTDSLSNPLFTASYNYGAQAFQYAITDMDLGAWTYTRNSLGELVGWTDAKSQTFSQSYDALSRITFRTEPEGTTEWSWGDNASSYNIGRLSGVSKAGYSESYGYDSIGRVAGQLIVTDQNYATYLTYNNQGALDTLTYPVSTSSTAVKVKYGYSNGVLQSVTDWTSGSAGTVYWTANAQNLRGQTTQETLGNGVVTTRSFDAVTGWLNSIQSGPSGGSGLQNLGYAYDAVGNVTQRQENTLGLTENFYYDNLYRLDYSTLNNGGGTSTNLNLTYDAMGNITNRSDVNSNATWTYHGTKKHAVATTGSGGSSFSYDANGNMTNRAGSTISWASYNYPTYLATATENTTFYYGPDRQYYRQDYNGPSSSETTYYIGGLLEKVCPSSSCASGTIDWRHYIKAEGQTVAILSRRSNGNSSVSYALEDNQGSGSILTNSSGEAMVRQSYTAFGHYRDGNDWDGAPWSGDLVAINYISRRGYTGHSMLGDMGLIHMNGRVYDAHSGRFLSADPFIPNPGFTQSYNRYAYVYNNPMSFIDPSGFAPGDIPLDEITAEDCNPTTSWGFTGNDGVLRCFRSCDPGDAPVMQVLPHGVRFGCGRPGDGGIVSGGNPGESDGWQGIPYTAPTTPANTPAAAQPEPASPRQGQPHSYETSMITVCSPNETMASAMEPGASAPGAPRAHDGFEPRLELWHIWSPNPISQYVSVDNRVIVNTALEGHAFQGTVTTRVEPLSGTNFSRIEVRGAGDRPESLWRRAWNNVVGAVAFTARNAVIAHGCAMMHGAPIVPN